MSTLTSAPVAPLLERLFTQADAQRPRLDALMADLPAPEQLRLLRSRDDWQTVYGQLKDFALPVSRETGRLLYQLARACGARHIVEFGTSFGLSTLHLAAALRDNGGGRLITTEFEPAKAERARAHLQAAGLDDLVEIRVGDALQTLAADLPERVDLLLLDGAKALYPDVLALVATRLRPGALIVADNADHSPTYLARVRDAAQGYLSVPFGDEVELSLKLN
ncbi:O-methyltransferase [Ideonella sp. DXS22W]|uniref:O-methyltransferase n=1 Tax=Pseudaquabacterium inlustre TaxID=2984192 RepID=A0ABU9CN88_9BURK